MNYRSELIRGPQYRAILTDIDQERIVYLVQLLGDVISELFQTRRLADTRQLDHDPTLIEMKFHEERSRILQEMDDDPEIRGF